MRAGQLFQSTNLRDMGGGGGKPKKVMQGKKKKERTIYSEG